MKKLISLMLVLVMCTLALTSCGGNGSPEAAVEAVLAVVYDLDFDGVKDLLPEEMWEELYDEMDVDEDDFWEDLKETFDDQKDEMDEYDFYEVDYDIKDVDELDEDDAEEYIDELEDYLKEDVTAVAIVEVEMTATIEIDGEEKEFDTEQEFIVFEYEGSWYVHPEELPFM